MSKNKLEENKTALELHLSLQQIELVEDALKCNSIRLIHDYISEQALELYNFDEDGMGAYEFENDGGISSTEIDEDNEEYDYTYSVVINDLYPENDDGPIPFDVNFHVRFGCDGLDLEVYALISRNGEYLGDIGASDLSTLVKSFWTMKALFDLESPSKTPVECPSVTGSSSIVEKDSISFGTTEKHFKASAKRAKSDLERFLNEKMGVDNSKISLGEAQQFLSHVLFYSPFQDTKKNILNNPSHSIHSENDEGIISTKYSDVTIVDVRGEYMLFVNGSFIHSTYNGTDMETNYKTLLIMAEKEARELQVDIKHNAYSDELWDCWEYDDLTDYFIALDIIGSGKESFFDAGENAIAFKINGVLVSGCGVSGDWQNEIEVSEGDEKPDFDDIVVWSPETEDNKYEWFFTLQEFLNAEEKEDGLWVVGDDLIMVLK